MEIAFRFITLLQGKPAGTMTRRLRLITGLIMALFLTLHLSNHSLGLISLTWMESGRELFTTFWHHPLATLALYGSVLIHFGLALLSLYRRSSLRMPLWEGLQLLLGLLIPPLVFAHAIGTRGRIELVDASVSYEGVIETLWASPSLSLKQTLLVLVVWAHLLIGLHYWLRLKRGYRRWLPLWQVLASLLPILALLGFLRTGIELASTANEAATTAGDTQPRVAATATGSRGAGQPAYPDEYGGYGDYSAGRGSETDDQEGAVKPSPPGRELLQQLEQGLWLSYTLGLLLVLMGRYFRGLYRLRDGAVVVEHPAGKLPATAGSTLLDALREAGIAHSAVCGGRARCTTCRVRVTRGAEQLSPPGAEELKALRGIRAESNIRLACQLELRADIGIVPLIPPEKSLDYIGKPGGVEGQERRVAALFVDLRGSTHLAEQRLPYDVVFILNQFFTAMVAALDQTEGHYAQFNGDGLMALYGLDSDFEQGCRRALDGAAAMLTELDRLNQRLALELDEPLRVGIGIHSGEAIVGTMGPPAAPILSAIGDTINTAARLEAETKVRGQPLIISRQTVESAGLSLPRDCLSQLQLRGRREPLAVYSVSRRLLLQALR